MHRWLRRLLGLSLLLIPAVFLFLAGTDTGLRCLVLVGNRLTADLLTIGSASGSLFGTLVLRDIRYADGIDTVTVDTLDLTWKPTQLLNGQIHIRTVRGSGVRVLLGESSGETTLSPFTLPVGLSIDTIVAETIAIFEGPDEVWGIRTGTIDHLSYRGPALNIAELSLVSDALTIKAHGQLLTDGDYPLQMTVDWKAHPDGYEPLAGHGTVDGPLNGLRVEAAAHAPFPMHLSGRLDRLLGATTWQARLEIPEVTLTGIHRDWPEQRFTEVAVDGRGTLADYTLHGQARAGLPRLKEPSDLAVDIRGNGDGLRLDSLHLGHGKTRLSAKGSLAWSHAFSWQAEINGTHLDPGLFIIGWPGDFTGALTTSGQLTPHGPEGSLLVSGVQGTLRGFPVTGDGEIHLEDHRLRIPHLTMKSGGSILRINGKAAETVDIALQLDSNNLAELWPGAQGAISAQGRVTGKPEKPQVDFKLSGSNVGVGSDGIQKLTMETKGILAREGLLDASVRAERLHLGPTVMDLSRLRLKGSLDAHSLEFDSQNKEFSTGFALQGTFRDHLWQATLNRSHFASRQLGDWRQRQPTALTFSPEQAEFKPLCLATTSSGSLCVDGSWEPSANTWQLHTAAAALPLGLLNAGLAPSWPLTGQLNADLALTGRQSRILSGKLSATTNDMSLRIPLPDGGTHQVTWKKNGLRATYADNRLQTVLDSALTDNSMVRAELVGISGQLTPETILRTPMSGSLQIHLQDLSPLTVLTDQMVHFTGMLQGQFAVSGTPASPVLNGQMELANGQAEIPPLGITLAPLQIKITGDAKDARLLATASSGKGSLRAEGVLHLNQLATGPHAVHLSGDTFKAAHLPGLDLDVTPDLELVFEQQRTEVRGTVTIPQARITSIDFHHATAPSDDMVVVDEEESPSAAVPVPLFTEITIIAGEDVHIDAYGLQGKIAGKLALKGQPGRSQIGNGTLSVHNGSFTVYGRRLKIDLGRLLFAGGPLTNPGIELRSERKGEKVTTGVLIGGFLQRPEMHFYSSPAMEQSAIMTNLLESTAIGGETRQDTGFIGTAASKVGLGGMVPYLQGVKKLTMIDEIKLETGEAYDSFSLVFGSWLTPDFYVSYGKDLVKESGTFNTRYTLGKGFSFLTETGASHSGGDIKYEFEH